jgi:hypothetical protein
MKTVVYFVMVLMTTVPLVALVACKNKPNSERTDVKPVPALRTVEPPSVSSGAPAASRSRPAAEEAEDLEEPIDEIPKDLPADPYAEEDEQLPLRSKKKSPAGSR